MSVTTGQRVRVRTDCPRQPLQIVTTFQNRHDSSSTVLVRNFHGDVRQLDEVRIEQPKMSQRIAQP